MNIDMKGYTATIGLEIHAHLKTTTKMFSRSLNDPHHAGQNQNISPIDMAHPGTLPTINKKAVEHMVRIGLAVDGDIANFTEFDRKNYFYPDIPKGYQISQYKYPIVSGGKLAGFELTRIHLEEDTATSKHFDDHSLVDYNRAGAPLMELVTEPVLHSSDDVMKFARELQLLLRYLEAGDANIEKGEMRVEVNLSVSKTKELGTKVEVKNIGSISAAGKATEFEIKRQIEALENGEELVQETRGWDDQKEITFSQRSKENAKDYRYFPEPDLPKLYLHEIFDLEQMKESLPELPDAKRKRLKKEYGIKDQDIEVYIHTPWMAYFFENTAFYLKDEEEELLQTASNYITSDIVGIMKSKEFENYTKNVWDELSSEDFAKLITMVSDGTLGSRGAKDILFKMIVLKKGPEELAEKLGLKQDNDPEAMKAVVQKIIAEHPEQVKEFIAGKDTLMKFFVGMAMKETKGSGNPKILTEIFTEMLK
ncbi:MAG: Asp-tRNA(Asn)/Glu-tRNA(Gln) amidotransferase subunit GatB [Candidatus Pacebacteria bacterium]|nr:Asp-tRNA(Asn)/Glu-tRNA(Gln) amidotransferase subunit GatB [Candidatus Paceibacterota bacterium]